MCENIVWCSGDDVSGVFVLMFVMIFGVWDMFGLEIYLRDLWLFVVDAFKFDRYVDSVVIVVFEMLLSGVDVVFGNVL